MKIKIYLSIIGLLFAFLVYSIFFMKSDYDTGDKLAPTVHTRRVDPVNHKIIEYIPDYLPRPIPEIVLNNEFETIEYMAFAYSEIKYVSFSDDIHCPTFPASE